MLSFNCQCSLLSNAEISQNRRIFLWALILILHSKSRFPNICVLFRMDKWLSRQPKVFQNWFYWFFLFLDSCMDYIFIHSNPLALAKKSHSKCWRKLLSSKCIRGIKNTMSACALQYFIERIKDVEVVVMWNR